MQSIFRTFAWALVLAAGCTSSRPPETAQIKPGVTAPAATLRDQCLGQCRPQVRRFYATIEKGIGQPMVFLQLPDNAQNNASCIYDTAKGEARISVRRDVREYEIAHELTHFQIDLVDRFSTLAWRRGAVRDPAIDAAFSRIKTYVDDDIVHRRLVKMGFRPDVEVLNPLLFDSLYAPAAELLEKGAPRERDGLGHLDKFGRGTLCRAAFLVQAEQILAQYGKRLSADHRAKTERFIRAVRAHRPEEAAVADQVLTLFAKHEVNTDAGHQAILEGWIKLEKLDSVLGISRFEPRDGRLILPWPADPLPAAPAQTATSPNGTAP